MNDTASHRPTAAIAATFTTVRRHDRKLAFAAAVAFSSIVAMILTLSLSPDPTGGELQASVTAFGIAIAVALASVVGRAPAR